jgi:hypothetical protein
MRRGIIRPMRFRKLRIAWSVVCGIACVLLIVLWVRSYRVLDEAGGPISTAYLISFLSTNGRLEVAISAGSASEFASERNWGFGSYPEPTTYTYDRNYGYMLLPYWLAILSTIGLGVVPWYASHFSLRTLLIATTLVAVVLGVVVWLNHH